MTVWDISYSTTVSTTYGVEMLCSSYGDFNLGKEAKWSPRNCKKNQDGSKFAVE